MAPSKGIRWTNESVIRFAGDEDPIVRIERKARELVLRARDAGWQGPPFNPIAIAELLKIPVEANADVAHAWTIADDTGIRIQFNPMQARERVRFSIAHEIAHTLFEDVAQKPRHRSGPASEVDEWQLEMLCNIAAAEFVMPLGSLPHRTKLGPLEELMVERRRFDVSAEAFLIRVTKISTEPIVMFCASPIAGDNGLKSYRVDYSISSQSAPGLKLAGLIIPSNSAVYSCTAIGYSDRGAEDWFAEKAHMVECVGIPGYPGSRYPRVAGLIRFDSSEGHREKIKFVDGDVLTPRGTGLKIICQLVNDQARIWGGGVAKAVAKRFPQAQTSFSNWVMSTPKAERLGSVHFADVGTSLIVASLVGQQGFGPSLFPRIRYTALESCFEEVRDVALTRSASVHMPKIGAGLSGGSWDTVEELVRDTLVADEIPVTVYDLPPKRIPTTGELFD